MGLFNKFSKKDKNTIDTLADKANKLITSDDNNKSSDLEKVVEGTKKEVVAAVEKRVKSDTNKDTNKDTTDGNRFTLLVEDAFQLKNDQGVVLGGNVHGTINNYDKVYILHPILGDGIQAEIEGIEAGPMNMVETASDTRVGIRFASIKDINKIPKYSVVTNIRPLSKPTKDDPNAESPFLYGLCHEYNRLIKEGAFRSIFTFALFSSNYITPVKVDVDHEKTTENRAVLKKDTKISFKLLHHPNDDKLLALPVFTDYVELRKWKQAYADNEQPQNFYMTFEQCAEIALKNGGYVINPFGDFPVFVSNENIKQVLEMKANIDKKISEEKKSEKNN